MPCFTVTYTDWDGCHCVITHFQEALDLAKKHKVKVIDSTGREVADFTESEGSNIPCSLLK